MAIDRAKLTKSAQKHLAKGNLDKAIVDYEKLVAGDPNDSRSLLKLGDLYTKKGAVHAACETYSKVANQYADQGFFLKAVAVYKQILKLDSGKLDIWERLAEMYELLTLTSDAIGTYERVAEGYTQTGKGYKALHALSKLSELAPDNVATQIRYAEALSKARRVDDAVEVFERAATLLKSQGRMDDYIKVAERLLYHQPDNAARARELARVYLDQQDARQALSKLQPCFKANPKDLETLSMLAEAFAALGQEDKTLSVYREMSRLYQNAGRVQDQVNILQAILQLAPDDVEARNALSALERSPAERTSVPVIELDDEDDSDLIVLDDDDSGVVSLTDSGPRSLPDHQLDEDTQAQVERLMTECEVFVKYGLHDKVEAQLKAVLSISPDHLEARLKLAEHYMQSGAGVSAAEQLVAAADVVHDQDLDLAIEYCTLAVQHDPSNAQAKDRLQWLAQQRPSEVPPLVASPAIHEAIEAEEDDDIIILGDDDDIAELPLDEDSQQISIAEFASNRGNPALVPPRGGSPVHASLTATMGGTAPPPTFISRAEPTISTRLPPFEPSQQPLEVDERPAGRPPAAPRSAPPPSGPGYPRGQGDPRGNIPAIPPSSGAIARLGLTPPPPARPPQPAGAKSPPLGQGQGRPEEGLAPPGTEALPAELADAIEEIEFYVTQGMGEEAEETLLDALRAFPSHPALLAKQGEVNALITEVSDPDTGVEEVLVTEHPVPWARSEPSAPRSDTPEAEDQSFALAEKLAAESTPDARSKGGEAMNVSDVIDQFRAGVRAAVDPSDAATHYDLGIAYMEMGLHAEAIEEFRLCLDDMARRCQAHTMIGLSYVSKGEMEHAVSHFKDALTYDPSTQEQLDLWFEIGNAYELLGKDTDALDYYQLVHNVDPSHRDVAERLQRLHTPSDKQQEEDEFDAMFDNLILKE